MLGPQLGHVSNSPISSLLSRIYRRICDILTGTDTNAKFARLSGADWPDLTVTPAWIRTLDPTSVAQTNRR
jgi:hypothetical protein